MACICAPARREIGFPARTRGSAHRSHPRAAGSSASTGWVKGNVSRAHSHRDDLLRIWAVASDALERERNPLPDAHAHGGERAPAAALLEAMQSGERKPRSRHAERMPERDRPAVRIDVLGIVGNAELTQTGQPLRGERLVDLDQIEVADLEAEQSPSACGSRAPGRSPSPAAARPPMPCQHPRRAG